MEIMNRSVLPSNVHEALYEQVQSQVISTVKWTLEHALVEEVNNFLGYGRYERGVLPRRPEATRSGSHGRELWTQYGCMANWKVSLSDFDLGR